MEITLCIPVLQEMARSSFALVRFALLFKNFALGPDPARLLRFWTEKTPYLYKVNCFVKSYLIDGRPHRENGPGLVIRYPLEVYNTIIPFSRATQKSETPYAGRLVRAYKSTLIYYGDSVFSEDQWEERQKSGKGALPKVLDISRVVQKMYYRKGKLHREEGPAEILYKDGKIREEHYYRENKRHRENGPASILYGTKFHEEEYFHNGKLHREDGPAAIIHMDGRIWGEYYHRENELHREDGPAVIFYRNDKIQEEQYFWNGSLHRENAPARIFYQNGKICTNHYYRNGKYHREDGPAFISYYNGKIIEEGYYRNDKLHREDGPAKIFYTDGKIMKEEYYRNDELYHKDGLVISTMETNHS